MKKKQQKKKRVWTIEELIRRDGRWIGGKIPRVTFVVDREKFYFDYTVTLEEMVRRLARVGYCPEKIWLKRQKNS
jgi:hypothetical protein